MGMYTGLRCKIVLKDEVVEEIKALIDDENISEWSDIPTQDLFRKRVYEEWSKIGRSSFIPFGSLAYMPWKEDDPEWQRKVIERPEGHILIFQCSLKNYEDEIESFFKMILPMITERSIRIEYLYEEWDAPALYEYRDGAIVIINQGGYENNDEWDMPPF